MERLSDEWPDANSSIETYLNRLKVEGRTQFFRAELYHMVLICQGKYFIKSALLDSNGFISTLRVAKGLASSGMLRSCYALRMGVQTCIWVWARLAQVSYGMKVS